MTENLLRGGSNTPSTSQSDDSYYAFGIIEPTIDFDKMAVFDWFSYTFDNLNYQQQFDRMHNRMVYDIPPDVENNKIMTSLFALLGVFSDWQKHPREDKAVNGYSFSYTIGEHIKINFAGPKSGRQRPTTQILMSGAACREFKEYQNGSWEALFEYCLQFLHGRCTRVDLAIDDFTANEIEIRDLYKMVKGRHFQTNFRSATFIDKINFDQDNVFNDGFSITFGAPGCTQLQIYDKKLERKAKGEPTFDKPKWYRYEMRFVDDRADGVITQYLLSKKNDLEALGKENFFQFAAKCLNAMIEFKDPEDDQVRKKDRYQRDPWQPWVQFIGEIEKIKLDINRKVEKTIKRKKDWYDRSIHGVNASFFLSADTPIQFFVEIIANVAHGLEEFDEKKLIPVNKFRQENKLPELTLEEAKQMIYSVRQLQDKMIEENWYSYFLRDQALGNIVEKRGF